MMILPNDLHIDMALDVSYLVLSKIAQYSILSFYFLNMHQLIHIAKLVYNKFDAQQHFS